ncbi:MAG: hypothetical protein M0020_05815 [Actinomycetota bacterium]|nr:hypothetical protein [Actinomycetota bacterium]
MDVAETTRPPVSPASPRYHYGDIAPCPRCGELRRFTSASWEPPSWEHVDEDDVYATGTLSCPDVAWT